MKHQKMRMYLSLFWVILGMALCVCHGIGLLEEFWFSMGFAVTVVGILQHIRQVRYRTDRSYREHFDTQTQDERNRFLSNRAWALAGYWFVLIAAVCVVVFKLLGHSEWMVLASGSVCLMLLLYWISYLVLTKKY